MTIAAAADVHTYTDEAGSKRASEGVTLMGSGPGVSESVFGLLGTPGDVIPLTPALDTSIYADGDVLFATTALAGMFRVAGGRSLVQSLAVIDTDDQGVAFDLFYLQTNVSLGTINAAPSITDADAIASNIRRICRVESTDYIDLGGCRIANKDNIGAMIEAAAGVTGGYLAAITRGGTPTYTASGLLLRLGVIQF